MRVSLHQLISNTILFKYNLPNGAGLVKTIFSTKDDQCYSINASKDLAEAIYNLIIDYSFNEFEIAGKDLNALHAVALQAKLKYNPSADETTKLKYGFYGEVVLYALLSVINPTTPIIARGYFYNPLENSETKGYDSYHLLETGSKIELWFGEVKFHSSYSTAINSALKNIDKAISDDYLKTNFIALYNHRNNFNINGSRVETILNAWEANPSIHIAHELQKHGMELVYPVMILYDQETNSYDQSIKLAVEYIKNNHTVKPFSISISYSIYFILIPMKEVIKIKQKVIEWIESKKQPIS